MEVKKAIVIIGATASGKSALAAELCKRFDGEVISADSMQVYRRMDIGTAKPTADELAAVRHHLIDIRDFNEKLHHGSQDSSRRYFGERQVAVCRGRYRNVQ